MEMITEVISFEMSCQIYRAYMETINGFKYVNYYFNIFVSALSWSSLSILIISQSVLPDDLSVVHFPSSSEVEASN